MPVTPIVTGICLIKAKVNQSLCFYLFRKFCEIIKTRRNLKEFMI